MKLPRHSVRELDLTVPVSMRSAVYFLGCCAYTTYYFIIGLAQGSKDSPLDEKWRTCIRGLERNSASGNLTRTLHTLVMWGDFESRYCLFNFDILKRKTIPLRVHRGLADSTAREQVYLHRTETLSENAVVNSGASKSCFA
ncbi:hypothetical protein C8R44DRAFT_730420 [Mycena epipterygia]|nr:hypothetical protein C8R44DRAFT_730420 [Mycena epipterygia]